jgi:hypothetical protein
MGLGKMLLLAINQVMKKIMQWKLQDRFNGRQNYWTDWKLGVMT